MTGHFIATGWRSRPPSPEPSSADSFRRPVTATADALHEIALRLGAVITELEEYEDDAESNRFNYLLGKKRALIDAFDLLAGR